jgi:hypothetical protein
LKSDESQANTCCLLVTCELLVLGSTPAPGVLAKGAFFIARVYGCTVAIEP